MDNIVSTILSVIQLVVLLGVLAYIILKLVKTFKPIIKNPDFVRLIIDAIADAETDLGAGKGKEKLQYVVNTALDYCEQNGVNFTQEQLTKIVNIIVAVANLIKKFIAK
mgnify:FL=1